MHFSVFFDVGRKFPLGGILADRADRRKIMVAFTMVCGMGILFLKQMNDIQYKQNNINILSYLGMDEKGRKKYAVCDFKILLVSSVLLSDIIVWLYIAAECDRVGLLNVTYIRRFALFELFILAVQYLYYQVGFSSGDSSGSRWAFPYITGRGMGRVNELAIRMEGQIISLFPGMETLMSGFDKLEVVKLTPLAYNITNTISFGGDFYGKKRAEYRPYCGGRCRAYC